MEPLNLSNESDKAKWYDYIYDDLEEEIYRRAEEKKSPSPSKKQDVKESINPVSNSVSTLPNETTKNEVPIDKDPGGPDTEKIKKENELLRRRISELFKTAKNEVERKDHHISELTRKLDDLLLKRNRPLERDDKYKNKHFDRRKRVCSRSPPRVPTEHKKPHLEIRTTKYQAKITARAEDLSNYKQVDNSYVHIDTFQYESDEECQESTTYNPQAFENTESILNNQENKSNVSSKPTVKPPNLFSERMHKKNIVNKSKTNASKKSSINSSQDNRNKVTQTTCYNAPEPKVINAPKVNDKSILSKQESLSSNDIHLISKSVDSTLLDPRRAAKIESKADESLKLMSFKEDNQEQCIKTRRKSVSHNVEIEEVQPSFHITSQAVLENCVTHKQQKIIENTQGITSTIPKETPELVSNDINNIIKTDLISNIKETLKLNESNHSYLNAIKIPKKTPETDRDTRDILSDLHDEQPGSLRKTMQKEMGTKCDEILEGCKADLLQNQRVRERSKSKNRSDKRGRSRDRDKSKQTDNRTKSQRSHRPRSKSRHDSRKDKNDSKDKRCQESTRERGRSRDRNRKDHKYGRDRSKSRNEKDSKYREHKTRDRTRSKDREGRDKSKNRRDHSRHRKDNRDKSRHRSKSRDKRERSKSRNRPKDSRIDNLKSQESRSRSDSREDKEKKDKNKNTIKISFGDYKNKKIDNIKDEDNKRSRSGSSRDSDGKRFHRKSHSKTSINVEAMIEKLYESEHDTSLLLTHEDESSIDHVLALYNKDLEIYSDEESNHSRANDTLLKKEPEDLLKIKERLLAQLTNDDSLEEGEIVEEDEKKKYENQRKTKEKSNKKNIQITDLNKNKKNEKSEETNIVEMKEREEMEISHVEPVVKTVDNLEENKATKMVKNDKNPTEVTATESKINIISHLIFKSNEAKPEEKNEPSVSNIQISMTRKKASPVISEEDDLKLTSEENLERNTKDVNVIDTSSASSLNDSGSDKPKKRIRPTKVCPAMSKFENIKLETIKSAVIENTSREEKPETIDKKIKPQFIGSIVPIVDYQAISEFNNLLKTKEVEVDSGNSSPEEEKTVKNKNIGEPEKNELESSNILKSSSESEIELKRVPRKLPIKKIRPVSVLESEESAEENHKSNNILENPKENDIVHVRDTITPSENDQLKKFDKVLPKARSSIEKTSKELEKSSNNFKKDPPKSSSSRSSKEKETQKTSENTGSKPNESRSENTTKPPKEKEIKKSSKKIEQNSEKEIVKSTKKVEQSSRCTRSSKERELDKKIGEQTSEKHINENKQENVERDLDIVLETDEVKCKEQKKVFDRRKSCSDKEKSNKITKTASKGRRAIKSRRKTIESIICTENPDQTKTPSENPMSLQKIEEEEKQVPPRNISETAGVCPSKTPEHPELTIKLIRSRSDSNNFEISTDDEKGCSERVPNPEPNLDQSIHPVEDCKNTSVNNISLAKNNKVSKGKVMENLKKVLDEQSLPFNETSASMDESSTSKSPKILRKIPSRGKMMDLLEKEVLNNQTMPTEDSVMENDSLVDKCSSVPKRVPSRGKIMDMRFYKALQNEESIEEKTELNQGTKEKIIDNKLIDILKHDENPRKLGNKNISKGKYMIRIQHTEDSTSKIDSKESTSDSDENTVQENDVKSKRAVTNRSFSIGKKIDNHMNTVSKNEETDDSSSSDEEDEPRAGENISKTIETDNNENSIMENTVTPQKKDLDDAKNFSMPTIDLNSPLKKTPVKKSDSSLGEIGSHSSVKRSLSDARMISIFGEDITLDTCDTQLNQAEEADNMTVKEQRSFREVNSTNLAAQTPLWKQMEISDSSTEMSELSLSYEHVPEAHDLPESTTVSQKKHAVGQEQEKPVDFKQVLDIPVGKQKSKDTFKTSDALNTEAVPKVSREEEKPVSFEQVLKETLVKEKPDSILKKSDVPTPETVSKNQEKTVSFDQVLHETLDKEKPIITPKECNVLNPKAISLILSEETSLKNPLRIEKTKTSPKKRKSSKRRAKDSPEKISPKRTKSLFPTIKLGTRKSPRKLKKNIEELLEHKQNNKEEKSEETIKDEPKENGNTTPKRSGRKTPVSKKKLDNPKATPKRKKITEDKQVKPSRVPTPDEDENVPETVDNTPVIRRRNSKSLSPGKNIKNISRSSADSTPVNVSKGSKRARNSKILDQTLEDEEKMLPPSVEKVKKLASSSPLANFENMLIENQCSKETIELTHEGQIPNFPVLHLEEVTSLGNCEFQNKSLLNFVEAMNVSTSNFNLLKDSNSVEIKEQANLLTFTNYLNSTKLSTSTPVRVHKTQRCISFDKNDQFVDQQVPNKTPESEIQSTVKEKFILTNDSSKENENKSTEENRNDNLKDSINQSSNVVNSSSNTTNFESSANASSDNNCSSAERKRKVVNYTFGVGIKRSRTRRTIVEFVD